MRQGDKVLKNKTKIIMHINNIIKKRFEKESFNKWPYIKAPRINIVNLSLAQESLTIIILYTDSTPHKTVTYKGHNTAHLSHI